MVPIHIVMNFDDNYWALAYTVMRSACLSTKRRKDLVFHLCHIGLSEPHKAQLGAITSEFGATILHYEPLTNPAFTALVARLPVSKRFPAIVYTRLLLDRFLPETVERFIYLDCDTLVRRPIEELYDTDLKGAPIAAVADPYHDGLKLGRDLKTNKTPFDPADPYFNSGVLLVDRKAFAAADIVGRIEEMGRDGLLAQLYFDQDVLNYIFREKWLPLNWRFNVMMPRPAHETMGPAILHYTMFRHPWNPWSGAAFERTYRHVMTNAVFHQYLRERLRRKLPAPLQFLIGAKP